MKQKLQILIIASAAGFLAFSAPAQQTTTNPQPDKAGPIREGITQTRVDRMNDALKSSDVIGMTVKNYQAETIGTVQDLVVDVEHGRIVQVILSTGVFSGMDGMMTAVPPRALHHDIENKILLLDTTREKLKMSPKFEPQTWNEGTQTNRVTEFYVYFGENPYFISSPNDNWATNTDGTLARTLLSDATLTNKPDKSMRNVDQTPHTWSDMGDLQKATALIGMTVNNLQEEKLGAVENLLVDLPSGRIVAVIISSGGFLGMGGALSPVPPTALHFASSTNSASGDVAASAAGAPVLTHTVDQTANPLAHSSAASPGNPTPLPLTASGQNVLHLDATKKMLGDAPHFNADQWPDFGQPTYIGGIYRAYDVQPYYNTNAIIEPVKINSIK